jgi:hypothetical protein
VKRLCRLVGHTEVYRDGGYPVCRCGAHAYYDEHDWNRAGLLYLPVHWFRIAEHGLTSWFHRYFRKCGDCGRFELLFGRPFGHHEDCLPF